METVIKVDNVKKSLQGREILKGISLEVGRGDIFGFLGPNGAGKTTMIRVLLGLYKMQSGNAWILESPVGSDEARMKIGFLMDGDGLYDSMSAEENLAYYLNIYGKSTDKREISRVLKLVELSERAKDKVGTFSKGMRQKLGLAKALVHNPEVLILDEPTSGLDPSAQIEFRQLMLDVVKKENKTVFYSSHNLDEVQKICNRIALLKSGQIKLYGDLESLRKNMGNDVLIIKTSQISDKLFEDLKKVRELGVTDKKPGELILMPKNGIKTSKIIAILSDKGVDVEEVIKNEASLEEMYSSIVEGAE